MKRKFFLLISFASILTALIVPTAGYADSTSTQTSSSPNPLIQWLSRDQLEQQMQEKAKSLFELNRQLEEKQQNLKDTKNQRLTLQKNLNTIQDNIIHLNLNIKADEITVQKLSLEVQSLQYDIKDIQDSMSSKREAIADIFKTLQRSQNITPLAIALKNESLAQTVIESQSLSNLQEKLTVDMATLRRLQEHYNEKIAQTNSKRDEISFHQKNLTNRKIIAQDQKQEQEDLIKQTKNKESIYEQQVAELKKVQEQIADEIETLDAALRAKINPSDLPAPGSGVLALPLDGDLKSLLSQGYGATAFAQYGYRGKWHNGADFRGSIGTPVYAAEDGVIVATGDQDRYCRRGAYGKFIVVRHNNKLVTLYAHLSRIGVSAGQHVHRRELIGYVGSTGYATGPHLHLTVFAEPTFYMGSSRSCGPMPLGGDLNPLSYL